MQEFVSFGNKKLPSNTMIFNLRGAMDCPSRVKGLCKLGKSCYAYRAERQFPSVRNYRINQERFYLSHAAYEIAAYLNAFITIRSVTRDPIERIRFSEAGDFLNQEEVGKFTEVFERIKSTHKDIVIYGYTARKDLDFSEMRNHAVVNGSGFTLDNNFTLVDEIDYTKPHCIGDCRDCDLCMRHKGLTIQVKKH